MILRCLRGAACVAAATLVVYAPACKHDDHDHGTGPPDAVYQGTATDEGLTAFEAVPAKDDAAKGTTVTAPANGAKVAAAAPAKLEWKAPTALFDRSPSSSGTRTSRYRAPFPLEGLRSAHAHGAPMNGRAYLLVLKSGGTSVVRVFTTDTSYTPDNATWTMVKTAKSITATISSALFDNNNVVQGSGPFVGTASSLTIE